MHCTDCGSESIHEDYQDGSCVCKSCGLVLQNFLVDSRPFAKHLHDDYYIAPTSRIVIEDYITFRDVFDIPDHIFAYAQQQMENTSIRKSRPILAAALYTSFIKHGFTRFSKEDICTFFQLSYPKLEKCLHVFGDMSSRTEVRCHHHKLCNLVQDPQKRAHILKTFQRVKHHVPRCREFIHSKHDKVLQSLLTHLILQEDHTVHLSTCLGMIGIKQNTYNKYIKIIQSYDVLFCS